MITKILKTMVGRAGMLMAGCVLAAATWAGFSGALGAAPRVPDAVSCLPTCVIDARHFVVAGNDPTTLSAEAITIGLAFTAGEPVVNFEIFDADRGTNWDTVLNCGDGCAFNGSQAPELALALYRDPAGDGTGADNPANLIATWTPGAVAAGIEQGPFGATNNTWAGDTLAHDGAAIGTDSNYHYALVISPFDPTNNRGWNTFKIRAEGTVTLLGNQIVGFIGAMNASTSDLNTVYPAFPAVTPTIYNGAWVFPATLPPFLSDVTIFDGDMDFGNVACTYNDLDDPDTDNAAVPSFAVGSAAVPEGTAVATNPDPNNPAPLPCVPGPGIRTGTPADDANSAATRRTPTSGPPDGIIYRLRAPDGQVFQNLNPSGNKEWEQFKIQKVASAADIPGGIACPNGGFAASGPYPASDCRTTVLPGGNWTVELDGMDMQNLNFWFFSFKVDPQPTVYSIGRRVWFDTNGDGNEDAGEPGAVGVAYTVTVFDSPGGVPADGTVVRTGVTGVNGLIDETGLPAGNYTVTVDASNFDPGGVLEGYTSTTGGEVVSGVEVGLPVCTDTNVPVGCGQPAHADAIFGYNRPAAYFIVIDEDSIDNGIGPNNFSASAVNDQIAKIGLRAPLPRFNGSYIGTELTLYTGQIQDEGWFAVPTIPASWVYAGPTTDGLKNFVGVGNAVGKGLGTGKQPEKLLDKIPDVTPLRTPQLNALVGATLCAVVYDSDISINYNPLNGSLKGANLGIVAFEVLEVTPRVGASSSSLPQVRLLIVDPIAACSGPLTTPPLN